MRTFLSICFWARTIEQHNKRFVARELKSYLTKTGQLL